LTEKEITLIKVAQKGDTVAFGELVALYDAKVMNLAISLLGSKEDAQDIYQEIFTKVFKSLKKYRFKSEFFTWLYRITVNTCLSYRKQRGKRQERYPFSIDRNPEGPYDIPDPDSTEADENVLKSEMSEIVKRAVDSLPPRQKAVIVLRHYHQKKIREIAEIMNLNEGTIKGYLFRAVRSMKDKVEPYYQGEV